LDPRVNIADEKLPILSYADDIALIAETPEEFFVCLSRLSNFSAIRRLSPLPVTGLQI
jgi:hypothetical protein